MEVIPGLPNDLAMEVFLRLPTHFHPQAMETSSLWRIVLCSDRFYSLRRLRTPFPSLVLLTRKQANPVSLYQVSQFDITYPSSVAPRLLSSTDVDAGPLCGVNFPFLWSDRCISLGITSLLLLNHPGKDGWMQFNLLSRQWMPFRIQAKLPCHLQIFGMRLLGLLDSRIFLAAPTEDTPSPSREVALSYDYITDSWEMLQVVPERLLNRGNIRFTFQGQIFVRTDKYPCFVYAFDSSTKSWKEHAQMTKRLHRVLPSSRIVATFETFICVKQIRTGILEVRQQDVGQTKWSRQLKIATGCRKSVQFHLLIKDEHIFIVTECSKDSTHGTRCQEFVVGQRRLTCIFVPDMMVDAVLMGG